MLGTTIVDLSNWIHPGMTMSASRITRLIWESKAIYVLVLIAALSGCTSGGKTALKPPSVDDGFVNGETAFVKAENLIDVDSKACVERYSEAKFHFQKVIESGERGGWSRFDIEKARSFVSKTDIGVALIAARKRYGDLEVHEICRLVAKQPSLRSEYRARYMEVHTTLQTVVASGYLEKRGRTVMRKVESDLEILKECRTNRSPVARAGPNQWGTVGELVSLDGSSSDDPDGDRLTFLWTQTGGPPATLSDPRSDRTSFAAKAAGNYAFELEVSDGDLTGAGSVFVTVRPAHQNTRPNARAGADQQVTVNTWVTLDASASDDPDNDPLTFLWEQTGGPHLTLDNPHGPQLVFKPGVPGTYAFSLQVNDGALSGSDFVVVNVTDVTGCPVESLGEFTHNNITGTNVERSGSMRPSECKGYKMEVKKTGDLEVCIPAGYNVTGDLNDAHFIGLKKFPDDPIQYMEYVKRSILGGTTARVEVRRRAESADEFKIIAHLYPPGQVPRNDR